MLLLASLTVLSYSTFISCNAFANLLYKYPDLGVLNAVSIIASLPVIDPKKNSTGLNPVLKLLLIKPCASVPKSFFLNKDKVLSTYPFSILLPLNACCPTRALICTKFNMLPLAPDLDIIINGFVIFTFSFINNPILFLVLFNKFNILASKVSFTVFPGSASISPLSYS